MSIFSGMFGSKTAKPLTAPGPTSAATATGAQPPDATLAASTAQTLALTAAQKQKTKATAGTVLTPPSAAPVAGSSAAPKTLLGY